MIDNFLGSEFNSPSFRDGTPLRVNEPQRYSVQSAHSRNSNNFQNTPTQLSPGKPLLNQDSFVYPVNNMDYPKTQYKKSGFANQSKNK